MTSKKTGAAAAAPRAVKTPQQTAAKTVQAVKAVKAVEKAATETVEQAAETVKETATQAVAVTERAVEASVAKAKTDSRAAFAGYGEFVGLQQEAFDAVMQSGSIMAKGYEAIGKEVLAFTQSSLEANLAAAKAMFGAKSLQEVLEQQAGFARESLDKAMAESAKLGEMTVKMTSEAAAPIQARVNAAVESVTKQIAA